MQIQKNVRLAFKRYLTVGENVVPFLGEGGEMAIQLNNDGSVLNASKVWRQIRGVLRTTRAKQYDQAFGEALGRVPEKGAYKLADWTWGYEEESGNVRQAELKAVYIFNFMPRDAKRSLEFPPMAIKVSAHLE